MRGLWWEDGVAHFMEDGVAHSTAGYWHLILAGT